MLIIALIGMVECEETRLSSANTESELHAIVQMAKDIISNTAKLFGIGAEPQARRCHIAPTSQPLAQLGSYGLTPPRSTPSDKDMKDLLKDTSK
jgi:hypothetical protein